MELSTDEASTVNQAHSSTDGSSRTIFLQDSVFFALTATFLMELTVIALIKLVLNSLFDVVNMKSLLAIASRVSARVYAGMHELHECPVCGNGPLVTDENGLHECPDCGWEEKAKSPTPPTPTPEKGFPSEDDPGISVIQFDHAPSKQELDEFVRSHPGKNINWYGEVLQESDGSFSAGEMTEESR
jgi:hypothetical protein